MVDDGSEKKMKFLIVLVGEVVREGVRSLLRIG